ncbi:MAG TPA: anti-sigma factor, partial [Bryobacteraceae bacterium]|nr:anti-sigma factor [Bryobacteraceae bacterium]
MSCDELRDEYEAYALGVAEDPERTEIREHLARQCPTCTHGVREAAAVVAAMSALGQPAKPPKALRKRVIAMVGGSGGYRFGVWLPWGLAFVLALVLASVIIPARRQAADAGRFEDALAILNDPSAKDVSFGEPAKPARGRVFVSPRRGIALIAANLPSIAADRTFEMWVIPQSGKPIPAGTFRGEREGVAIYVHPGPVSAAAAVA